MKTIPVFGGHFALVDDEDYEYLSQFKWHLNKKGYARRSKNLGKIDGKVNIKTYSMHREIMRNCVLPNIDHRDGNPLNNQKSNLRAATCSQNSMNKKPQWNAFSKYKGVSWRSDINKWRARIMSEGKNINIGHFSSEKEAAAAYDEYCLTIHSEFARPNGVAI